MLTNKPYCFRLLWKISRFPQFIFNLYLLFWQRCRDLPSCQPLS